MAVRQPQWTTEDEGYFTGYQVHLERFEGPLDLLLYLIKRDKMDIYDIPIVHITDQYLAYLHAWPELDLEGAGEFLVMAATLMQIKSQMLLPQTPKGEDEEESEEEEDPRSELVEMLLEYRRYKEAAGTLRDFAQERSRIFTRDGNGHQNYPTPLQEMSLMDLLYALQDLIQRRQLEPVQEVKRDRVTVAQKITAILAALKKREQVPFQELLGENPGKLEIIVAFLALLELVRARRVRVLQDRLFDRIFITRPRPKSLEARGPGPGEEDRERRAE